MGLIKTKEHDWSQAMRAANRGDQNAYRALLTALTPCLRALIRRILASMGQNTGEAEDIVQEVLLAIHLRKASWDESQPILPWISAIARYKTIDFMRRKGRRMEVSMESIDHDFEAPTTEESILDHDVTRLTDRLAEGQRKVVLAVSVNGLTIRDAASRFGMSEVAARVALHRGLKALAKLYRSEDR